MNVTDGVHIDTLCGSQRDGSYTRLALEHVLQAAATRDATTDVVDVASLDLPVFDPDRTDAGDAASLRQRVRDADAVALGTPLYHGSYSSQLKTVLDYCGFDEFEGKTVGLLAVSGGGFPTPALDHLRSVSRTLDAWVLPHQVAVPHPHRAFEGGDLTDESLRDRVETLGTDLVDYAGVATYPDRTAAATVATVDRQ